MKAFLSAPGVRKSRTISIDGTNPLSLEYGESLTVTNACGARVRCDSGQLWITEEGRIEDIVLQSGQSTALVHRCRAVVRALKPSRVAIEARARTSGLPGIFSWLQHRGSLS